MSPAEPLIEARALTHEFPGGFRGLEDVSLGFRRGEFVIIAGKNGSGKTLLVRHLLGLVRPTSGEVLFRGEPAGKRLAELRKRIGFVFQDTDHQLVAQSVEDELRFGPENARLPEDEIVSAVGRTLERLDLGGKIHVPPSRLSGGEKRRLAVGGVLAMDPDILVLDEPFANLDYPGVRGVLRLVVDLHRRGTGIVLITHELEKALAHADRLVIMDGGKVAEDGPAETAAAKAGAYGLHPLDFTERSFGEYTWLN